MLMNVTNKYLVVKFIHINFLIDVNKIFIAIFQLSNIISNLQNEKIKKRTQQRKTDVRNYPLNILLRNYYFTLAVVTRLY